MLYKIRRAFKMNAMVNKMMKNVVGDMLFVVAGAVVGQLIKTFLM
jgi:hypothetical protein